MQTRTEFAATWPPTADVARKAGHTPISPLRAIRARCLDCCAGQVSEIRLCEAVKCPAWPFRAGRHPWLADLRKITPSEPPVLSRTRPPASGRPPCPGATAGAAMTTNTKPGSWRDVIGVHPAADLFPLMAPDELKALGEDIRKNGLKTLVTLWGEKREPLQLLDGRNRLDAMEAVGIPLKCLKSFIEYSRDDLMLWEDGSQCRGHHRSLRIRPVRQRPSAPSLRRAEARSDRQVDQGHAGKVGSPDRREYEGEPHHRRQGARRDGGEGRRVQNGHEDRHQGPQAAEVQDRENVGAEEAPDRRRLRGRHKGEATGR